MRDNADHQRSIHVFGPMVHELFNEDSGIVPPQLKGPYGTQQLLAMTADRMVHSQLRAIVTIPPLYGGYTIKFSENRQNAQYFSSIGVIKCYSSTSLPGRVEFLKVSTAHSYFPSLGLQTASCFIARTDCSEVKSSKK